MVGNIIRLPGSRTILVRPFSAIAIRNFCHDRPRIGSTVAGTTGTGNTCSFCVIHRVSTGRNNGRHVATFVCGGSTGGHVIRDPSIVPTSSRTKHTTLTTNNRTTGGIRVPNITAATSPDSRINHFFRARSSGNKHCAIALPSNAGIRRLGGTATTVVIPFSDVGFSNGCNGVARISCRITGHTTGGNTGCCRVAHR